MVQRWEAVGKTHKSRQGADEVGGQGSAGRREAEVMKWVINHSDDSKQQVNPWKGLGRDVCVCVCVWWSHYKTADFDHSTLNERRASPFTDRHFRQLCGGINAPLWFLNYLCRLRWQALEANFGRSFEENSWERLVDVHVLERKWENS